MTGNLKLNLEHATQEVILRLPCSARSLVMSPEIARRLAVTLVEYADALTRPRLDDDTIHSNGGHDDRR